MVLVFMISKEENANPCAGQYHGRQEKSPAKRAFERRGHADDSIDVGDSRMSDISSLAGQNQLIEVSGQIAQFSQHLFSGKRQTMPTGDDERIHSGEML